MKEWVKDKSFDIAHAQHWLSAKSTVEASRAAGLPVVITVRDYWPVCIWSTKLSGKKRCPGCSTMRRVLCVGRRRPWLWPLAPLVPAMVGREIRRRVAALERASAVIAVSKHIERMLPVRNSVVIPNLLDLSEIERRMVGPPSSELPDRFALFVGKLELNKSPDRLLPILRAAGVRLPLVIAGEGSLEESLKRNADRADEEVRFVGWVDPDVALRLMHRAAALLFPSRWDEPLSRVLLEGLGAGAVLIVEPTGGSEEIVIHDESGLLGRNVEELGAALRRVTTEEGLATKLRQGARRRAREHFSKEVVIPKVEELYGRVVKGETVGG
jgi:glycosyltransferase involved in cell wall biosynthesis